MLLLFPNWNAGTGVDVETGVALVLVGVCVCPKLKAGADADVDAGTNAFVFEYVFAAIALSVPVDVAVFVFPVAGVCLLRFRFMPRKSLSSRSSRSRLSNTLVVFQAPTVGRLATYCWSGARPLFNFLFFLLAAPPSCCRGATPTLPLPLIPFDVSPFNRRFLIFSDKEDGSICICIALCWPCVNAAAIGDGNRRFAAFIRTIPLIFSP